MLRNAYNRASSIPETARELTGESFGVTKISGVSGVLSLESKVFIRHLIDSALETF